MLLPITHPPTHLPTRPPLPSPPHTPRAASKRELRVWFNADVADDMPWDFRPTQEYVRVRPGQSTLVFFTAHNKRCVWLCGRRRRARQGAGAAQGKRADSVRSGACCVGGMAG